MGGVGGGAGAGEIIFLRVPNSLEECDGLSSGKIYAPGGPNSALKETANLYFLAVEYEAAMCEGRTVPRLAWQSAKRMGARSVRARTRGRNHLVDFIA
jgi:hypothetical protein